MKTKCGVYTVQFPASHVTNTVTGQKDVKMLMSLYECVYVLYFILYVKEHYIYIYSICVFVATNLR